MTANENYLFDHDENVAIDANSTISTFVAYCSHSDCMCDLGISQVLGVASLLEQRVCMVDFLKSWIKGVCLKRLLNILNQNLFYKLYF